MTYDNWKTTNPADAELGHEGEAWGQCDQCLKYPCWTHRCWAAGGTETWRCEECEERDNPI